VKKEIQAVTVGEIMTHDPVTVRPDTDLRTVKRLFEERDFNAVPVVDAQGRLVGLVTKLHLLRLFRPDRRSWIPDLSHMDAEKVADIMDPSPVQVHADDPATVSVDLMIELNLRSLPVTERGSGKRRLVGMVSRRDVLKSFVFGP
jgi:CBS domain-containing protein